MYWSCCFNSCVPHDCTRYSYDGGAVGVVLVMILVEVTAEHRSCQGGSGMNVFFLEEEAKEESN